VRVNTVHPGYMPPMLNATNAGGARREDRADAAAPRDKSPWLKAQASQADRGRLGRAVPRFREASFVTGRRARHRRRLYRSVALSRRAIGDSATKDKELATQALAVLRAAAAAAASMR